MSAQIRETAAEVAALIPRYSWEIMDSDQRDELVKNVIVKRYEKTTSDGEVLGASWWARQIGVPRTTIQSRVAEIRARDQRKPASAGRPSPNEVASIRSAKSAIKKYPELVGKLLEDDKVAGHVEEAVLASVGQTRTRAVESDASRTLNAQRLFLDVNTVVTRALRRLPDYRPTKSLRDDAEYAAQHAEAFAIFARNWADGVSIADEVEQWMAEDAR